MACDARPGDSERRGFANGDPYLVHNGEGKLIANFTDEQLRDVIALRSGKREASTNPAPQPVTVDKPATVAGTGAHPKTPEVMASLSGRMTPTDAERAHAATLYAAVKRSRTDSGAVAQGTQKVAALKRSIEDITDKLMHAHDAHKRAQDAAGPTAGERHHRASAELTSQRDRKIAEYRGELAFLDAARKGGTITKGLLSPLTAAFEELTR